MLQKVHLRNKYEYFQEHGLSLSEDIINMSPNQEYKLVHGLPGGGKTELLKLIRSLLEDVWLFVHGVHFVMTARLNSMANNLHGVTMHKYWRIAFQNSGGAFVNSVSSDDAWTDLLTRCASLKRVFIDEIETCDIQLFGTCAGITNCM